MTEWKPNSRNQELALSCPYTEIGVGGGRGGGKSEVGLAWLTHDHDVPQLRQLVVRKNYEDMRDWIDRATQFFKPLGAVYQNAEFRWANGGIMRVGHFKDDKSFQKYVGQEYDRILIEELNLIPREENYLKLLGSLRSTTPDLQEQIMSNFNPSDEGYYWIKKRFGLHGIPQDPVVTQDERTGLMRAFIPLRVRDNPVLAVNKTYMAFLEGLPDGLREAWKDGNWDEPQIEGAYYTLELQQMEREGRLKLVPIDKTLKVHTVWDLGRSKGNAMAVGFFQRVKGEMRCVHYYENEGYGISHFSAYLQSWQRENQVVYGKHFAPFDIKNHERSTNMTTKDIAKKMGLEFEDVPKLDRNSGIEKARLMFPRLWISAPYCEQLVSAVRNYKKQWDDKLLRWKPEPMHDWASNGADMLRYAAIVEEKMTNEDRVHYKQPASAPTSSLETPDQFWSGQQSDDGFGDIIGKSQGLHRKE